MADSAKILMHVPQFLLTWSIFFGFGLAIYVAYAVRAGAKFAIRELIEHCVPFNIFTEKSFHADVIIYSLSKITNGLIAVPSIVLSGWFAIHSSQAFGTVFSGAYKIEFGLIYASLCTIVAFVAVEFSDFVCHYTEHKVPFLWELHKVHHSAQVLNPLTSQREHPGTRIFEALMRGAITSIPGGLFMFLFDLSVVEVAVLPAIATRIFALASLDPLKHSHHPISLGFFDKILISPHMHQVHHSKKQEHWDKNFGTNLSIFDWLAGTGYKPAKGEMAIYGISGLKDETLRTYNTMQGAYWIPLKKSGKKLKKMMVNFYAWRGQIFRRQTS